MIDWQGRVDIIANALMDEVKHLRAVNELLYAALQDVEWIQSMEDGDTYCPFCYSLKMGGHDNDCHIKQALDAARPQAAKPATGA